jgi:hypothetical protein
MDCWVSTRRFSIWLKVRAAPLYEPTDFHPDTPATNAKASASPPGAGADRDQAATAFRAALDPTKEREREASSTLSGTAGAALQ